MAEQQINKQQNPAPEKKGRSPGYPAITLAECLKHTKTLWEKEGKHPATVSVAMHHFAFSPKSSGGLLAVAALRKFGLVSTDGNNEKRTIKLTSRAIDMLNPATPDETKAAMIKDAALLPTIHRELWEKYRLPLPSDQTLLGFLEYEKGFTKGAAAALISEYKETLEFAKLKADDIVSDKAKSEDGPDPDGDEQPPAQNNAPSEEKRMNAATQENAGGGQSKGRFFTPVSKGTRAFNFPLPSGMAAFTVPFPFTESDFESLISTLKNFKEGLVEKEIPTLDTGGENYKKHAEALAESGMDFDVSNFTFSFDFEFLRDLSKKHDFRLKFNVATGMAFLRKSVVSVRSFPAKAIWKNRDHDQPVQIVAEMGEKGGVKYFQSEDGTGIPGTELTFQK